MAEEKKPRKVNPALMKPVQPDSALGEIVGLEPLPRSEIMKRVWDYIKKNNLQDSKNKRNINADNKLERLFDGKKTVSMFEMTKHIFAHLS